MELLLLLTAFLASLTGVGAGEGGARHVEGVAVVRAAEMAEAVAQPARRALPAAQAPRALAITQAARPPARSAALAGTYLPFERRLE